MLGLPKRAWRTVRWREGSMDWLSSRFARVRVGVGHNQLVPEKLLPEWLLIEWPEGEAEPTKYWLSTLPSNIGGYPLYRLSRDVAAFLLSEEGPKWHDETTRGAT
jgi:hypothetical protein